MRDLDGFQRMEAARQLRERAKDLRLLAVEAREMAGDTIVAEWVEKKAATLEEAAETLEKGGRV